MAVEALTRGIPAKLLHEPTVGLKDAAGTAQGDRLSDAVRDLFRFVATSEADPTGGGAASGSAPPAG